MYCDVLKLRIQCRKRQRDQRNMQVIAMIMIGSINFWHAKVTYSPLYHPAAWGYIVCPTTAGRINC